MRPRCATGAVLRLASLGMLVVLAGAGVGCHGDLYDLEAGDDAGAAEDGAAGELGSSGPPVFAGGIESDLDRLGCAASGGCHGGIAPMRLVANPMDDASLRANYQQVLARAMSDSTSLLLVKPLQGRDVDHPDKPFMTTSDPTYQRWLAWIRSGAPFSVDAGAP